MICVAASARRLVFALTPTALDTSVLLVALRGAKGRAQAASVRAALAARAEAEWETALTEALAQPHAVRAALVNEQLTELDYRAQRWARVPRVCASVATSTSFLLASLALREGLARVSSVTDEGTGMAFDSLVISALNVATIGLAGAAFCIAMQMRARSAVRARLESADALVERLEALANEVPTNEALAKERGAPT